MPVKADGVFEGGGVRGIALVGAAEVAEEYGYRWVNLAGTSAGAIIAALLAAEYRASRLVRIMRSLDLTKLAQRRGFGRIPIVGPAWSLYKHNGLASTAALRAWLEEMLLAKGVRNFGDLKIPRSYVNQKFQTYRLAVIASDITRRKMVVLPYDLPEYGVSIDHFPVADAVCMSAAAPIIYQPISMGGSLLVDGGLLSNFPVWLFDSPNVPTRPTFGFRLGERITDQTQQSSKRPCFPKYMAEIGLTILQGHDAYWEHETRARSMIIPTGDVNSFNFHISDQEKEWLYQSGRKTASEYFQKFDFVHYQQRRKIHAV